jgi:hypothetical protein
MNADELRKELAAGAKVSAHVAAGDAKILDAARERHAVVQARLDELRPKAVADGAAGEEYSSLVAERGRLDLVLGGGG